MLQATSKDVEGVKWIFVKRWFDHMQKEFHNEYISEDGRFVKTVDDYGYEEISQFDLPLFRD